MFRNWSYQHLHHQLPHQLHKVVRMGQYWSSSQTKSSDQPVPGSLIQRCESCGADFKPVSCNQAKEGLCRKCLKINYSYDTREIITPIDDNDEAFADKQCKVCFKDYSYDNNDCGLCLSCHMQIRSITDDIQDNASMATLKEQPRTNDRDNTRGKQEHRLQRSTDYSGSSIPSWLEGSDYSGSHRMVNMETVVQDSTNQLKRESAAQILEQMDRLAERERDVYIDTLDSRMSRYKWRPTLILRFIGSTWSPSDTNRTQVGPMLAPRTLLSGFTERCDQSSSILSHNYVSCFFLISHLTLYHGLFVSSFVSIFILWCSCLV